ncbi:MAG: fimbria major subunit [Muribaculaceae bacterium]|nr:fimbria major subunit [Muribaculaceae bacterium]
MKISINKHIFAYPLFLALLAACSDHAIPDPMLDSEDGEITLTLRIPIDSNVPVTRANPVGGEDGNGREYGLEKENTIYDANIFFFKASSLNPGNPQAISVTDVYVPDLSKAQTSGASDKFEKSVTIKIKTSQTSLSADGLLPSSTGDDISFIAVLNAGKDLSGEVSDLKALREMQLSSSHANDERFVMTTAYDADAAGIIKINGENRKVGSNRLVVNNDPDAYPENTWEGKKWKGEATVQRLCGRIDLMYKTGNIADDELIYTVSESGNKVHITNILPVNVMAKPSYLLTKTTAAIPSAWTEAGLGTIKWGGVQATDASSIPSNYVIEPTTLTKISTTSVPSDWYGSSSAASVKTAITNAETGKFSTYYSGTLPTPEDATFGSCDKMTIISYADENILAPESFDSHFITGISFRALFQPGQWCREGNDGYVNEILNDETWNKLADKTFYRYLPTAGVDAVDDSEAIYFHTKEEAEDYAKKNPADLATITEFKDGVCYYNLWLRHFNLDNADPQQDYPMEYAIVRNNIYRVAITFSGPGDPVPTMREPDTMMSRIFVRKWNQRKENNPLQF